MGRLDFCIVIIFIGVRHNIIPATAPFVIGSMVMIIPMAADKYSCGEMGQRNNRPVSMTEMEAEAKARMKSVTMEIMPLKTVPTMSIKAVTIMPVKTVPIMSFESVSIMTMSTKMTR